MRRPPAAAAPTTRCCAAPAPPPPPQQSPQPLATFHIPYRTEFGHHVAVVGSHPTLGNWAADAAAGGGVPLQWSEGDVWVGGVALEGGASASAAAPSFEYKYVVRDGEGRVLHWQPGDNFRLDVGGGAGGGVAVVDSWCGAIHETTPLPPTTTPAAALVAALKAAAATLDGVGPASEAALAADAAVAAAAAAAAAAAGVRGALGE